MNYTNCLYTSPMSDHSPNPLQVVVLVPQIQDLYPENQTIKVSPVGSV